MSDMIDWLAGTFYTSDADVQTHQDVAAAQQEIVDRQYQEGKRNISDYIELSGEVKDAGNMLGDYKKSNSGIWGFMKAMPWWIWAIAIIVPFGYLGGFAWLAHKAKGRLK